jgi:hypothetical protein
VTARIGPPEASMGHDIAVAVLDATLAHPTAIKNRFMKET